MRLTAPIQICNLSRMEVAAIIRVCRSRWPNGHLSLRVTHAVPSSLRSIVLLKLYVPALKSMTARLPLYKSYKNRTSVSLVFSYFPPLQYRFSMVNYYRNKRAEPPLKFGG